MKNNNNEFDPSRNFDFVNNNIARPWADDAERRNSLSSAASRLLPARYGEGRLWFEGNFPNPVGPTRMYNAYSNISQLRSDARSQYGNDPSFNRLDSTIQRGLNNEYGALGWDVGLGAALGQGLRSTSRAMARNPAMRGPALVVGGLSYLNLLNTAGRVGRSTGDMTRSAEEINEGFERFRED